MLGGLTASTRLINTNGRCLINSSINSLMNSHEIMKLLYSPHAQSLNNPFSEIVSGVDNILIDLLSSYVYDYIHEINNTDLDKFMFVVKNLEKIMEFTNITKLRKFLDENYAKFSHSKILKCDFFIGLALYPNHINMVHINFRLVRQFQRKLSDYLKASNDVYFMISIPDDIDTTDDLTLDDIKHIKTLFKISITSTEDYICTDMICYKANEKGFNHVVYYNLLDSTLTDDTIKTKTGIRDIIHDDDYVFIPCLMHYQKLRHNEFNLDGTYKTYDSTYQNRIDFIKHQISSYQEQWIKPIVEKYLKELF